MNAVGARPGRTVWGSQEMTSVPLWFDLLTDLYGHVPARFCRAFPLIIFPFLYELREATPGDVLRNMAWKNGNGEIVQAKASVLSSDSHFGQYFMFMGQFPYRNHQSFEALVPRSVKPGIGLILLR